MRSTPRAFTDTRSRCRQTAALRLFPIYGSTGVGKPGIDGHEMLFIDIASRKIVGNIDFGHGVRPHLPVLDPATGMLYVTTELDKSVTIVDPKTRKIVGAVPTGQDESHMLAISHDGKRGYTANVGPGTVSVLDMAGRKTLAVIPVSKHVQRISISNDDKLVFTADQTKPELVVIDTGTQPGEDAGGAARHRVWHGGHSGWTMAAGRCSVDQRGSGRGPFVDASRAHDQRAQFAAGGFDSADRNGRLCLLRTERKGRGDRLRAMEGRQADHGRELRRWARVGEVGIA